MKRTGDVLDIEHDKAVMFMQPVKLELTSSGHYCVNIKPENNPEESEIHDEEEILTDWKYDNTGKTEDFAKATQTIRTCFSRETED